MRSNRDSHGRRDCERISGLLGSIPFLLLSEHLYLVEFWDVLTPGTMDRYNLLEGRNLDRFLGGRGQKTLGRRKGKNTRTHILASIDFSKETRERDEMMHVPWLSYKYSS